MTATAAAPGQGGPLPALKTIDDFDFTVQTSVTPPDDHHLDQLDFWGEAKKIVFPGPSGTGKTDLSITLGVQAAAAVGGSRHGAAVGERLGAAKRSGRTKAVGTRAQRRVPPRRPPDAPGRCRQGRVSSPGQGRARRSRAGLPEGGGLP